MEQNGRVHSALHTRYGIYVSGYSITCFVCCMRLFWTKLKCMQVDFHSLLSVTVAP